MNDKHIILFKCCPLRQPRPGAEEDLLLLKRTIYDYAIMQNICRDPEYS